MGLLARLLGQTGRWATLWVGPAVVVCAGGAWGVAQGQEPAGTPAPPPARVHLHLGALDGDTASARSLAPEVADVVARVARRRAALVVTEDPLRTWMEPAFIKHEGALLGCMDPWATKTQVLTCIRGLDFPPPAPRAPATAQFLLRGAVRSGDHGTHVSATLAPFLDGQPGPVLMGRTVLLPRRASAARRERLVTDLLGPLLDAAQAQGQPPQGAP